MLKIFFYFVIFWWQNIVTAQNFAGCDYYQNLNSGQTVNVFSPNYGSNLPYSPGVNCRWTAVAPYGHQIVVSCRDIRLPWSQNCANDRIEISYTGDRQLSNAQKYCTNSPFSYLSNGNQLAIALRSLNFGNQGGYFLCDLTASPTGISNPQPQPIPQPIPQPVPNQNYAQCGRRKRSRIVGGSETIINEFPMMAGLVEHPIVLVFCGAVIVSNYYAVSSAHCFIGKTTSSLRLLVGDHDYSSGTDSPYALTYYVSNVVTHSQYNSITQVNDIAMVRTSSYIQFNAGVGPACLPTTTDQFEGRTVEAVGWGSNQYSGAPTKQLQKVSLGVISYQQCYAYYGSNRVSVNQICTLTPGRDTCQFDSGGPMFLDQYGVVYLVGLVSFGTGCANGWPSVNTRVSSYTTWIQQNMY